MKGQKNAKKTNAKENVMTMSRWWKIREGEEIVEDKDEFDEKEEEGESVIEIERKRLTTTKKKLAMKKNKREMKTVSYAIPNGSRGYVVL